MPHLLADRDMPGYKVLFILKANAEYELKERLINSLDEPTALIVTKENVTRFSELLCTPDY